MLVAGDDVDETRALELLNIEVVGALFNLVSETD